MPSLPPPHANKLGAPHVVLLGAGASHACAPKGDLSGKILPLMANLVDVCGLEQILAEEGITYYSKNFEELYDSLFITDSKKGVLTKLENQIFNYFSELKIPNCLTLYDKLILSLRPKDLIATFNWDPLLLQAYRRNMKFCRGQLPGLVFLHGNVGIGYCEKHKKRNYSDQCCTVCGAPLMASPLLFPVSDKRYRENPFIDSEWKVFEEYLGRAYLVTIYGYSAPKSDMAARELMKKAWDKNGINFSIDRY